MADPSSTIRNSPEREKREDLTTRRLRVVEQRYGKKTLELAAHAAFPLTITSDLLYCLRENFVPDSPWYAVGDVLLSGLCEPIGYDLYEMEEEIRHRLLKSLDRDRFKNLSMFMAQYILHRFTQENNDYQQEWIPLSYLIANGEEVKRIRDNLQNLLKALPEDNQERIKWKQLEEKYIDSLQQEGFEPLLLKETPSTTDEEELEIDGVVLKTFEFEVAFFIEQEEPEEELKSFEFETVTVNTKGKVIKREQKQAFYFVEYLGKAPGKPAELGIEMVAIPGGTFTMGSPEDEEGYHQSESPQHTVTLQPFFLGKYPITQAQWRFVSQLSKVNQELIPDSSGFKGKNLPVERVSWEDAKEFCLRLSNYTGRTYTLPSEAEWEYAARAGTITPFYFGETITGDLANYYASSTYANEPKAEYRKKTTPVYSFRPNNFGLHDMHGNVFEWCQDDWHSNYKNAPNNGSAWLSEKSINKVIRGGSWFAYPYFCRSAFRNNVTRAYRSSHLGFRVVCVAPRTT
ncbi:MAG: formylglycine-generating enzyme family protein [Xenococcaceae cyanobacterium MO_207.B15]|nr:formylglycine-generating enzyme family protein [Xenococcaceae cyanobacterium MO_207.B15]